MTTPRNPYNGSASMSDGGFDIKFFAREAAERVAHRHDHTTEPGLIWSAVGKPVSRVGAGRYSLTEDFLVVERGVLSTDRQQIRTHEIFDVDGHQTMTQKARAVGTVTLRAKRPSGELDSVELVDIPEFRQAVQVINTTAEQARIRMQERANSQTLRHEGPQPSSSGGAVERSLNSELQKLADLKLAGLLTDEEFAAAKRKLLGL
ncbi:MULTISPECIES: PH domain-containing protein [unclassified Corynebacterium]|uniref:PH domain-containing protein n=1 Tax=unclassified Corynebacterium TaxID=2624378 RepID=UPI00210E4976|nr:MULTISPECIES: PH domain-containing protein [unclassified Corynebacterium]